jgi:hypothetical protein
VPEQWRLAMARADDLERLFGTFADALAGEIAVR